MTATINAVATIPAALLYWHHVPQATIGSGNDSDALAFRFERVLPMPVEQLHVTASHLPDGSALVIGIEPAALRMYLGSRPDITPATWELIPDQLPPHLFTIPGAQSALAKLNVLHGSFEPAPRLRLRQITAWCLHLGCSVIVFCVLYGVERRVEQARLVGVEQRLLNLRAIEAVVPPQQSGHARPDTLLTMELRRLEQAAQDPAGQFSDMAQVLQSLWLRWPPHIRVQVDLLSANAERIVIRGQVPTLQDVESLARACQKVGDPPQTYRMEPLQAQQNPQATSFLLTLVHELDNQRQP